MYSPVPLAGAFDAGLDTLPNNPVGGVELLTALVPAPPNIDAVGVSLLTNRFCSLFGDANILPVDGAVVLVAGAAEPPFDDKLKLENDSDAGSLALLPNIFPVVG